MANSQPPQSGSSRPGFRRVSQEAVQSAAEDQSARSKSLRDGRLQQQIESTADKPASLSARANELEKRAELCNELPQVQEVGQSNLVERGLSMQSKDSIEEMGSLVAPLMREAETLARHADHRDAQSLSELLDRVGGLLLRVEARVKEMEEVRPQELSNLRDKLNLLVEQKVRQEIQELRSELQRASGALDQDRHKTLPDTLLRTIGIRLIRIAILTALGGLVGGPAIALALGDPFVDKTIEGAIGAFVGTTGAEAIDATWQAVSSGYNGDKHGEKEACGEIYIRPQGIGRKLVNWREGNATETGYPKTK